MSNEPLLIVLSGPSGVGKDSVLRRLQELGRPFHFTVTATTRAPRANEVEGRDYFFFSPARFMEQIEQGAFLEHADVYGQLKGVPKQPVLDALARGEDVIMRTDIQGADHIRAQIPGAVLIFLLPESLETLEQRLLHLRRDSAEQIARRLESIRGELEARSRFDYAIVNAEGELDRCATAVDAIAVAEKHRVHRAPLSLIGDLRAQTTYLDSQNGLIRTNCHPSATAVASMEPENVPPGKVEQRPSGRSFHKAASGPVWSEADRRRSMER